LVREKRAMSRERVLTNYVGGVVPPGTLDVTDGPDDDRVDRAVQQLNTICKVATMDFALAVGKLIIDEFYDGRVDSWRLREPKDHSLRKLSRHPDLPMSPGALYRSVAMYEVCSRLGVAR